MHPFGGDRWSWSWTTSRPVGFCVWVLLQDGLQVSPFDVHAEGNQRFRRAGMDAAGWVRWFDVVVTREVEGHERIRMGGELEPALWFESDPPTVAEQLRMKQALRAKTPPALWQGTDEAGELLDDLWDEYSNQPVLRRNRFPHTPRDLEEPSLLEAPGTSEQRHRLYGSLRQLGTDLPSLYCYAVAYPTLVVREVAPMALVITSPRQWTWERYRDAMVAGVEGLARRRGGNS
jgi:hypothetical protein